MARRNHAFSHRLDSGMCVAVCGMLVGDPTANWDAVTCKLCIRRRGTAPADHAYRSAQWILERTREPLIGRPMTQETRETWSHILGEVAAVVAGDEHIIDRSPPARFERWASVTEALQHLVEVRVHGYTMANIGDPDALYRKTDATVGSLLPSEDPSFDLANDLRCVEQALSSAYGSGWTNPYTPAVTCRKALLLRLLGGETADDVAAGLGMLTKTVNRVVSHGTRVVHIYLRERGLVSPSGMPRQKRYDLVGAQDIAEHLGVTEWFVRASTDMPTAVDNQGRLVANRRDVTTWFSAKLN